MFPVALEVEPEHIEVLRPAEQFPVGDVVQVHDPAFGRAVGVVARIVHRCGSDATGPEPREPQAGQNLVVERTLSDKVVVRIEALQPDEPVALNAIEAAGCNGVQIVLGLERNPGSGKVVVIVLDLSSANEGNQPMVVGTEGCVGECDPTVEPVDVYWAVKPNIEGCDSSSK
jgi:hypothetical protein